MNIYEFQINDEKEWVVAHTLFKALKIHHAITGINIVEFDDEDDAVIVSEDEWNSKTITYPDDPEMNDKTFAEIMKSTTKPEYIGSTVY